MSQPRTIVIAPKRGFQLIDWRELWAYRDLIYFLVRRDVKVRYVQSVLGFLWAIIRPLSTMVVFTVVFGRLAEIPSDGIPYPIFSYAALVPWTYFSSSLTAATGSLVGNNLLSKVYFPRLIIPLNPVLSNLVDFAIALSMVGVIMAFYGIAPTAAIAFLPFLVLLMMLTASGLGMWLSAMAIQYRDVKFMLGFLSSILMYAAPVVWPASLIADKFPEHGATLRLLYGIYPMAGVIEGFRAALIGARPMPWDLIVPGAISALVIWLSGALYFRQRERFFADIF
ncbi:MAG: ABC transporter permease [Acidobacteria bacterium]|nr:MAG: ABC transporter permease [Acidobacteriota bacterium]